MNKRLWAMAAMCMFAAACQAQEPLIEARPPSEPAVTPTEKIELFNGKDLSGFTSAFMEEAKIEDVFQVKDGVIHCTGSPIGYLRTITPYENYRLRFEWRWPGGGGNSGVMVHMQEPDNVWPQAIEGQLQSEHAGDIWVINGADFDEHTNKGDRRVIKQHPHNEKPRGGEWNEMVVEVKPAQIVISVNGLVQNTATNPTITSGYIGWQSEATPIEFRNMTLEPLE